MALYEPGKRVVLYEEDGYRITGTGMCLTIEKGGFIRQTAGHKIEDIPSDIATRLAHRGYDPKDFIYVPYILIKAVAKEAIEEFEKSLKTYNARSYVRSCLTDKK